MTALVNHLKTASPQEQAAALAWLAAEAMKGRHGPVAVTDAAAQTVIGYLTPTAVAPVSFPELTDAVAAELRRRADNPDDGLSLEECVRQLKAAAVKRTR